MYNEKKTPEGLRNTIAQVKEKDAELVTKAFAKVESNLSNVRIFHTDRGNEFKNQAIDRLLEAFGISRSLSMKGCPYDNAVAGATYKIIKTEFVNGRIFAVRATFS